MADARIPDRVRSSFAMESTATPPPASSSPIADDVWQAYCDARRQTPAIEAMNVARRVAEAVSLALVDGLPADQRVSTADLNRRLEVIEKSFASGHLVVPRFLLAALRTLQAYGNCGSHYQKGVRDAPMRAATSAMESLAYVTEWFLIRQKSAARGEVHLALRQPAPGVPRVLERWRLQSRVDTKAPKMATSADGRGTAVVRDDDPVGVQLASLLIFHNLEVELIEDVAAVVLEREVVDPVPEDPRELVLRIERLSSLRPDRIPPGIVRSMEDVIARRDRVMTAINRDNTETAVAFLEEARARAPAHEVLTWFRRGYLGDTGALKTRATAAVVVGIAILSFRACEDAGERTGRNALRQEVLTQLCSGVDPSAFCDRLRQEQAQYAEELARQSKR